jgi:2-methylcitrate dehydratase PrpD
MMNGTNASPAIEAISNNVVDTRFDNFDEATVETAKNRIIDIIGCAIGGANAPGNSNIINMVTKWGGLKESTVWIHGGKVPAQNAAMVNAVMTRSYDFEVITLIYNHRPMSSHNAATMIPTALALGEAKGVTGRELITAMLVGEDLAARVQIASLERPGGLGWDVSSTLCHLGATATAGRLLHLTQPEIKNAFGIVLNLIAGSSQNAADGAITFKLGSGVASRNGIFAAELAQAGWTGLADALQSPHGYFSLYAKGCKDTELLTRDLGKKYYGEAYFRPYPAGMPCHVVIECALELIRKHDINPEGIEEVTITVSKGTVNRSPYARPFMIREFPIVDALYNLPYAAATTLIKKSVGLSNFTTEAITDPRVNAIVAVTKIAESAEIAKTGSIVTVKMKDGQEFSQSGDINLSWIEKPIPREKIVHKFWQQIDFSNAIIKKNAEKILELLENLEEVKNVNAIVSLLAKE